MYSFKLVLLNNYFQMKENSFVCNLIENQEQQLHDRPNVVGKKIPFLHRDFPIPCRLNSGREVYEGSEIKPIW